MPGLLRFSKVADGLPHRFRGMAKTPFALMPWTPRPVVSDASGAVATGYLRNW
jgi:hypothetical protein